MGYAILFVAVIVLLIIVLARQNRPMVSDGKGGLIPKRQYAQTHPRQRNTDRFIAVQETEKPKGQARGRWKPESTPEVGKVKAWHAEYDKTGKTPCLRDWESVSEDAKNVGGWSAYWDKEHPNPENDFF